MRNCLRVGMLILLTGCAETSLPVAEKPTAIEAKPPAPLPQVVSPAKVLVDEWGTQVTLLELANNKALIYIVGSRTEFDGKVIECDKEESQRGHRYVTSIHGRAWASLHYEQTYRQSSWLLYVGKNLGKDHLLRLDPNKAKAVKVAAILALHQQQIQSGELAKLQRFDRAAEEKRIENELAKTKDKLEKTCHFQPVVSIDWKSINDEQIKTYSIASYCGYLLEAMASLCEFQSARTFFKPYKKLACRHDDKKELSIATSKEQMGYTFSFKTANIEEKFKQELGKLNFGKEQTLQQLITVEKTQVCFADEKHFAILAPAEANRPGLSYGDGKTFFHVGTSQFLSPGWFLDPRQVNENHSSNFRGYDLRYYSNIEADPQKKTCLLSCGKRQINFTLADRNKTNQVLQKATYQPAPHLREPYALARDQRGTYYFVDRGSTEATKKDLKVYIGPRGKLKPQKMKDIVSDSEGEIFSTPNGDLRLVVGRTQAFWISKGKRLVLTWLPVGENLGLIYTTLGVYLSQKLGVPCDDF